MSEVHNVSGKDSNDMKQLSSLFAHINPRVEYLLAGLQPNKIIVSSNLKTEAVLKLSTWSDPAQAIIPQYRADLQTMSNYGFEPNGGCANVRFQEKSTMRKVT